MKAEDPQTQDRVRRYFQVRSRQLAAAGDLPVCEHSGLSGSHREEIQRVYLREILPKRFEVGRGMVYGPFHRSKEADIVIWDSQNYPSLPLLDHGFFFAESVKLVLESKSCWSEAQLNDVLEKCRSVRDIIAMPGLSLTDELHILKGEVASLRAGVDREGWLKVPHHIGTVAIFLRGGQTVTAASIGGDLIKKLDDCWPDVVLFLESGRLIVKNYCAPKAVSFGGEGWLEFFEIGADALLAFTVVLLELLDVRAVQMEHPLNLRQYVQHMGDIGPSESLEFPLTRPVPNRMVIWPSTGSRDVPEPEP
jgi:hypothetical protein